MTGTAPIRVEGSRAVGGRVVGVDVARALALLGMMSVHLLPQFHPDGTLTPAFWVSAGRASALFALLAGVGLALATGGPHPRLRPRGPVVSGMLTRAVLIAALGMALAALDPPVAVILTNYGLLFTVAAVAWVLRPRTLLITAAVWAVTAPPLVHLLRVHLPVGPGDQPTFTGLADPGTLLSHLLFTGYYPVLLWVPYILVGLALGRCDLHDRSVLGRMTVAGLALLSGARLVSDLLVRQGWSALNAAGPDQVLQPMLGLAQLQSRDQYGVPPTTTWWWQVVASPHTGTVFDLTGTIGSSLFVLGLVLLGTSWVSRRSSRLTSPVRGLVALLAAAGSMTLTLYSVHVVAVHLFPPADSGGHQGRLLATHIVLALALAGAWKASRGGGRGDAGTLPGLAVGRRGPLEGIVALASRTAGRLWPTVR